MKRGLVIGKFYPPHRGHRRLIEIGYSQVDELTVLVCDHESQRIPGDLRAAWIRQLVPGVRAIVVPDRIPTSDSEAWATLTLQVLGFRPEVVFTSEEYGKAFAEYLGAIQVAVERGTDDFGHPISGTAVREDPLRCWEMIDPCVRAYFAVRIVVIGAESTGTTTLAQDLAKHYETVWVPEYGRLYWEARQHSVEREAWKTEEFVFIAEQQNRLEDELAASCNRLLICDTDSFATYLWHERYVGSVASAVDAVSRGREPHLYLLTDTDIPFVQDGTREGADVRTRMHRRFLEELRGRGKRFILLTGALETRMRTGIHAIDDLIAQRPTALN